MRPWRFYPVVALIALLLLTALRLCFFYVNNHELISHPEYRALLIGLRFDICVVSYWLAPMMLLNALWPSAKGLSWRKYVEKAWILIGLMLILLVGLADVGWYGYFFSHLSLHSLEYGKNPGEALSMLWSTPVFRTLSIAFLLLFPALWWFHSLLLRVWAPVKPRGGKMTALGFCYLAFAFLGMRGGLSGQPINIRDNRYSHTAFFNDLALNPLFYLYHHSSNSNGTFGPEAEAYYRQLSLERAQWPKHTSGPLVQRGTLKDRHVVLILMESMASHRTGLHEGRSLTPFLDGLKQKSLSFNAFYSCGEHTYNGVYSVLTGREGLMGRHMLRLTENTDMTGLPGLFKSAGYYNIFQIPHGRNFDNLQGFLSRHHFDSITDHHQIPASLSGGNRWGVCDHRLYKYGISNLNLLTARNERVFSVLMSISNHPPYEIPDDAPSDIRTGHEEDDAVRYADWSLKHFFDSASRQPWFSKTVFILVADHGTPRKGGEFPLPLGSHHIPCIIYAPGSDLPEMTVKTPGSQTDIMPTLAWLMGLQADTTCEGVNLMTTRRPYVSFFSDAWRGITDGRHYQVLDEFGDGASYNLPDVEESNFWQQQYTPGQLDVILRKTAASEAYVLRHRL